MKRNLLFVSLLFVACMSAQAQTSEIEYHPFAEEGKNWRTQVGGILENLYRSDIIGDTIIGNVVWKKVYNEKLIYNIVNNQYVHYYTYYAAVRDEGKKVYAMAKGSTRPRLLYDFSPKEGDFIKCGVEGNDFGCLLDKDEPTDTLLGFPFDSFLKVDRIDTVKLYDGQDYRRFTLTMWDAYKDLPIATPIVWIEGLGSGAGPFSPWMSQSPILPGRTYPVYYTYYYMDNSCITRSDLFYELNSDTPNAVNFSQPTKEESTLYDLLGRKLNSLPLKGAGGSAIYIEDGQKKVMK